MHYRRSSALTNCRNARHVPDSTGPILPDDQKLQEELGELDEAESDDERLLEAGDVLFVAVNIVRRYGVDPEQALRASNAKFERRFREMESFARSEGREFSALALDEQEDVWQKVKASEKGPNA